MFVDKQTAQARFDVCKACDSFIRATAQCRECGCFMKVKVKIGSASCPEGRW